jgi:hypothetical protein
MFAVFYANTPHQAYHSVFLDEPNQQLIGERDIPKGCAHL